MNKIERLADWLDDDKAIIALLLGLLLIIPSLIFWFKDDPNGCSWSEIKEAESKECNIIWDNHGRKSATPESYMAISFLILEIIFIILVAGTKKPKDNSWKEFVLYNKFMAFSYALFITGSISTILLIVSLFTPEILKGVLIGIFWITISTIAIIIYYFINVGIAKALNNPKGGRKE